VIGPELRLADPKRALEQRQRRRMLAYAPNECGEVVDLGEELRLLRLVLPRQPQPLLLGHARSRLDPDTLELGLGFIMLRKPRRSSEPLVSTAIVFRTLYATAVMVIAIIGIFKWSLSLGNTVGQARAAAFTLLVISSVFYGLCCRSTTEFALGPSLLRPNKVFWASVVGVPALQAIIVHVAPINQFFSCEAIDSAHGHCQPLGMLEWGVILAVATFIFLLVELEKAFVLPHILNADWHFPHIFHHVEGEEDKWHFLATSASFHGVSHLKTTHTPAAGSTRGAFSSQNLAAKLQSKRSLVASNGSAAASAGDAVQLEVRALL
jgi:hypothetical protein